MLFDSEGARIRDAQRISCPFCFGEVHHHFLWRSLSFHDLIPHMKIKLAFVVLFALTVTASSAQTLIERLFIMKVDRITWDSYSGMTSICVLLYPDGRYRLEKRFVGVRGYDPGTRVYLDTLPDADFKAFLSAIDDPQLQEIKTSPPNGGIYRNVNMDTLHIIIPREHLMQDIMFPTASEQKPFEKSLKPFLNYLKNLEKRKVSVAKNEKPNNCESPHVMYGATFRHKPDTDDPAQH
jgi:hypothetical protein